MFPKDHETYPASYVKKAMNLVWSREHEKVSLPSTRPL